MQKIIDLFILDRRLAGRSQETLKWYRAKLKQYECFATLRNQKIEPSDVLDFLDSLHCTDEGKAGYWRVIRAFYRWAAMRDYLPDPTLHMRPRFAVAAPRSVMSHDLIMKVLAGISTREFFGRRDLALFSLIYFAGLRSSEARLAKVDNLDLEGRKLAVAGKGNKTRGLPLAPVLARVLTGYVGHVRGNYLFPAFRNIDRPLDLTHVSHKWRDYQRAAGIEKPWRVHDLRHACATMMRDNDVDLADIQAMLGHSTIQVTQRYARQSNAKLMRAVDKVFG